MPRPNITRFTNLAIDTTLDDSNPYKIMRCPRITNEEINNIPEDGLKGGEIIYNTDIGDFQLYNGTMWNNYTNTKEILFGYVYNSYTSNLTPNDHVKYDSVEFQVGNNISLDTATPYTNSAGVDSIGRITLQPNRLYKLMGFPGGIEGNIWNNMRWYNADANIAIGPYGSNNIGGVTPSMSDTGAILAYFKPEIVTRVELRHAGGSKQNGMSSGYAYSKNLFTIETV